jgi:hypothetical protein
MRLAANRIPPRDNGPKGTSAVMTARMWIMFGSLLALVAQPRAACALSQIGLTGAGRGVIVVRHQCVGMKRNDNES